MSTLPDFLNINRKGRRIGVGSDRAGTPGALGRVGLFSGADPNNPDVMHMTDGIARPSEQAQVEPSPQTSAGQREMGPLSRAVNDAINAQQPAMRPRAVGNSQPAATPMPPVDSDPPVVSEDASAQTRPRRVSAFTNPAASTPAMSDAGGAPGVEYDPAQSATRARVAHPLEFEEQRNTDLRTMEPEKKGWSWKREIPRMVAGFLGGARGGDPLGGVGSAISTLAGDALDPQAAGRRDLNRDISRSDARLDSLRGTDEARTKRAEGQATIRLRNAQAGAAEARPGIEADKAAAAALNQRRAAALRTLAMLKGQQLDPINNPQHAALMRDLQETGVHGVDPESWNDSKSNLVRLTATDPDDPTKTNTIEYNTVTGAQSIITQKGFQQPVNSETGMTAAQTATDNDRDDERKQSDDHFNKTFNATQHQRAVQNDLARLRIGQGDQRLDLARDSQDMRLDGQTRSELKAAYALQAQIAKAKADADSYSGLGVYTGDDGKQHRAKWATQKETDARNKAAALQQQFDGTYSYLMQDNPATPAVPGVPAAPASRALPRRGAPARSGAAPSASNAQPPPVSGRMSRATFRQNNPRYKDAPDADVDAVLRQHGIAGY